MDVVLFSKVAVILVIYFSRLLRFEPLSFEWHCFLKSGQALSVPAACHIPGSRCHSSTCWGWEEAFYCSRGGQHGRPPQPVLCHSPGADISTGDCPGAPLQSGGRAGPDKHGSGATDSVLQVHTLQTHSNHLLPWRGVRGTDETGAPISPVPSSQDSDSTLQPTSMNKIPLLSPR